jgi:hypothetical protein
MSSFFALRRFFVIFRIAILIPDERDGVFSWLRLIAKNAGGMKILIDIR